MTVWLIFLLISISVGCLLSGRLLIHYFQLESYQFPGYFRTVKRNFFRAFLPGVIVNIVWIVASVFFALIIPEENEWLPSVCVSVSVLICGIIVFRFLRDRKAKKPLRYTPRIKRLYLTALLVFFLLLLLLWRLSQTNAGTSSPFSFTPVTPFFILFPLLLPLWIALAGLIAWPIEKLISEMYFRDAQRILRNRPDLIRIGITGSWGKTSVKFILGTILKEKYQVLVTPASFNTPMGVTKVIRNDLAPGHRVFIAEMGARHVGDIREMCRLVHPEIGVLTSVGPQHLDTFRTVERVAKTKYELMDAIPKDTGRCFFSDDADICRQLYLKTDKQKTIAGLYPDTDDIWAEDITAGPEGSRFMLCTRNERIPCSTVLLGKLNIQNILLSASVAMELGLTAEQIARGISRLKPIEHRLQLISNPGGITIIDDAFNSNIIGAEHAFQTLKDFPGRRIVITPGMVELGKMEKEMNRQFGEKMASCCDAAILVGKGRSESIAEGLKSRQFPENEIHITNSLEEAADLMRSMVHPGDTVLFENDLPDNYES